jgi:hypothetical protein
VTAMHAMQVTLDTSLGIMPGALTFSHDTFLNITQIAEWKTIAQHSEQYVNDNLHHTNRK